MTQAACNANVGPRSLSFKLEAVTGLSQQALIIDVAAKILADNITSLMCSAGAEQAKLPARVRHQSDVSD